MRKKIYSSFEQKILTEFLTEVPFVSLFLKALIDNHYKTFFKLVRTEFSSSRVLRDNRVSLIVLKLAMLICRMHCEPMTSSSSHERVTDL